MATYAIDLSNLRKACTTEVVFDDEGKDVELVVTCKARDVKTGKVRKFVRRVDVRPLIATILQRFATQYGTDVSGWRDYYRKASRVARRVAQSKAVKSLAKDLAPIAASAIPGGSAALVIATKAAVTVQEARAGVPEAIDKVKTVAAAAAQMPESLYAQVLEMMRQMNEMLKAKEAQAQVSGWLYNVPYRGPVAALSVDPTSPFTAARALYSKGLS